jgi:hypothetical protein
LVLVCSPSTPNSSGANSSFSCSSFPTLLLALSHFCLLESLFLSKFSHLSCLGTLYPNKEVNTHFYSPSLPLLAGMLSMAVVIISVQGISGAYLKPPQRSPE